MQRSRQWARCSLCPVSSVFPWTLLSTVSPCAETDFDGTSCLTRLEREECGITVVVERNLHYWYKIGDSLECIKSLMAAFVLYSTYDDGS